jgi:hypothetical protein
MIAYFADGPLNGQVRDIPSLTYRYRVPLLSKPSDWGLNYWEGSDVLTEVSVHSFPKVGYYEPSGAYLKTGAQIFVFQGIE